MPREPEPGWRKAVYDAQAQKIWPTDEEIENQKRAREQAERRAAEAAYDELREKRRYPPMAAPEWAAGVTYHGTPVRLSASLPEQEGVQADWRVALAEKRAEWAKHLKAFPASVAVECIDTLRDDIVRGYPKGTDMADRFYREPFPETTDAMSVMSLTEALGALEKRASEIAQVIGVIEDALFGHEPRDVPPPSGPGIVPPTGAVYSARRLDATLNEVIGRLYGIKERL